jgi:hypothetical protein
MFDVRIVDNYIRLPGNFESSGSDWGGFGIEAWGRNVIVADNQIVYESTTTGDEVGISCVSPGSVVSGNQVVNAGLAVEAGGSECRDVSVTGNTFRGCRSGVMTFGAPERIAVTNNVIEGFTFYGIQGNRASVIAGNLLTGSARAGGGNTVAVWLTGATTPAENPSVTGNVINITSVASGTLRIAFRVEDVYSFALTGNSVGAADYGVYLTGQSGQTHDGVIVGNDFSGTGDAYFKAGASTDATVRWANAGDIPSRAAYASTDALLIAHGVIKA